MNKINNEFIDNLSLQTDICIAADLGITGKDDETVRNEMVMLHWRDQNGLAMLALMEWCQLNEVTRDECQCWVNRGRAQILATFAQSIMNFDSDSNGSGPSTSGTFVGGDLGRRWILNRLSEHAAPARRALNARAARLIPLFQFREK